MSDEPLKVVPAQLSYEPAPKPGQYWLRRGRRLALMALIGGIIWFGGHAFLREVRIRVYQRQCMTYAMPGDVVAFQEPSSGAVKVLHTFASEGSGTVRIPATAPVPAVNYPLPAQWRELAALLGVRDYSRQTLLFLGQMHRPDGEVRLVAVFGGPVGGVSGGVNCDWHPVVIIPGSLRSPRSVPQPAHVWPLQMRPEMFPPSSYQFQIYSGQLDPADASHITFRYRYHDEVGTVDGRLDNNDRLTFTRQNSPRN